MIYRYRKASEKNPNYIPKSVDPSSWAAWKEAWKSPEFEAASSRNSTNRCRGRDKAESTHIGGSVSHARTMRKLVSYI